MAHPVHPDSLAVMALMDLTARLASSDLPENRRRTTQTPLLDSRLSARARPPPEKPDRTDLLAPKDPTVIPVPAEKMESLANLDPPAHLATRDSPDSPDAADLPANLAPRNPKLAPLDDQEHPVAQDHPVHQALEERLARMATVEALEKLDSPDPRVLLATTDSLVRTERPVTPDHPEAATTAHLLVWLQATERIILFLLLHSTIVDSSL